MEAGVDVKAAALCQQEIDIGTDVGIGTDIGIDIDIDKVDKVDGQKTRMTIFASSPFTIRRKSEECSHAIFYLNYKRKGVAQQVS